MKPDWKDAPEWASWLAMDEDGDWFWYESEPKLGSYGSWCRMKGQALLVPPEEERIDHKKTLEPRP